MKIKVCGMTNMENMLHIVNAKPDYLGFIFYSRSARYVGDHPDPALFSEVPEQVKKVGVFVNAYLESMLEISGKYGIGILQLHGMESPELCMTLHNHGFTVVKAISGEAAGDYGLLEAYSKAVDFLLFDTPVKGFGGSGRKFDWSVLQRVKTRKEFFLGGGIGPDDCRLLKELEFPGLYAVDINSRFETVPGVKDFNAVNAFINCIRNGEQTKLQGG